MLRIVHDIESLINKSESVQNLQSIADYCDHLVNALCACEDVNQPMLKGWEDQLNLSFCLYDEISRLEDLRAMAVDKIEDIGETAYWNYNGGFAACKADDDRKAQKGE